MDKDRIDALRAEFLDDDGERPMSATLVAGILDAMDALVVANANNALNECGVQLNRALARIEELRAELAAESADAEKWSTEAGLAGVRERDRIVVWLRTQAVPVPHAVRATEKTVQMLATAIERGAHLEMATRCGEIRQPEVRPQRFVCRDCGYGVKADEDGCCATCGRDCAVVEIVSVPGDWSDRIRAAALGDEDEGPE